jgi:hypothetical protein
MTMFPFRACRSFILGAVFFIVPANGAGTAPVTEALNAGQYDAAYDSLQGAYANGLSEDSLYYFWAEIYYRRGALDTALALNIAAQRKNAGTLTNALLQQRYLIYATLGWVKESGEILDSLRSRSAADKKFFPRFSFVSWSGVNVRNILEENPYPFYNVQPVYERITNPGQDITLKSAWYFPLGKKAALVPAVSYNFSNGVEQSNLRFDSLNHSFGVSLDLRNFWQSLSLGYSLQQRISIFQDVSTQNIVTLSRLHQGKRWLAYSSLMYLIERARESAGSYQGVWFMNYFSRRISASTDFALAPLMSCFLTDDLNSVNPVPVMYIEDPAVSPVTHYTDASCTQTIPIPSGPLTPQQQRMLLASYRGAAVTQDFLVCAPESYVGATPTISISHKLSPVFSLEAGLKGMAYYYLTEHEWVTLSAPNDTMLACSNSDGRYYTVEEFSNINTGEIYGGPLEMTYLKKRRIDFGVDGDLALKRRLWANGTAGVNVYMRKYWSNMENEAPSELKDFFFGGGFSLSISFGRNNSPDTH